MNTRSALALVPSIPPVIDGEIVEDLQLFDDKPRRAILARPTKQHGDTPDLVALYLGRRSAHTVRAYEGDLRRFFKSFPEYDAQRHTLTEIALEFCAWPPPDIAVKLQTYKSDLLKAGRAEATVNRQIAAVRSLLKLAYSLGRASTDGRGLVEGEKVQSYRDTRGIDVPTMRKLLKQPPKLHGVGTLHALRDEAILRLLCENGLRRSSVITLNGADFVPYERRLHIKSKGHGSQRRPVTISHLNRQVICEYLTAAGHAADTSGPLFRSLDRNPAHAGTRLTDNGLWKLVRSYGVALGLPRLAPHMLRHSAITALLEETKGDVRTVQKYSGHAKIDTLLIYDDNRVDRQGEMTDLLSTMLAK